jgi:hypothetical protein
VTDGDVQVGKRVWFADTPSGVRMRGVIASAPYGPLAGNFVIVLDVDKRIVTCTEDDRGTRWDFVTD